MVRRMRARAACWLLGLGLLSLPHSLRAQVEAPRSDIAPTLRVMLPFQHFTVVNGNERTEYVGLGVGGSVLVDGTWASDAGLGFKGGGDFTTTVVYARFGVTPTLLNSGDVEGGWTLNAGPKLGFEAQWRGGRRADLDVRERVQALTHSLSLDLVRWWTDGTGTSVQLRAGLVLPVSRSEDENWSNYISDAEDFHHGFDIGGSVGWSL